ncbi:MAG: putative rane protein [Deltaproteobacteria bacterium]|nr:putative rane protein [Deltaproteobacteria bacterium]
MRGFTKSRAGRLTPGRAIPKHHPGGEMKTTMKMLGLILVIIFAVSSGYADEPKKYSGFLDGFYDKLQPGPKDGARQRWLKPGVDFTKYNRVMLDSVVFFLSDESYKGIDPQDMKELADTFNKEMIGAMKDKSKLVSEPWPDAARVRLAITGLKQNRPGVSAVTSVIPAGLAVSLVKKGASGSWSGSGATSMEVTWFSTA